MIAAECAREAAAGSVTEEVWEPDDRSRTAPHDSRETAPHRELGLKLSV